MYLETMQDILTHSPALVVDDKLKGLVPFLPLNLPNPAAPTRPATPGASAQGTQPQGAAR
jgi:membrane protease subunit HflK